MYVVPIFCVACFSTSMSLPFEARTPSRIAHYPKTRIGHQGLDLDCAMVLVLGFSRTPPSSVLIGVVRCIYRPFSPTPPPPPPARTSLGLGSIRRAERGFISRSRLAELRHEGDR